MVMGIRDRFFGNSKKQSDKIDNPTTIDIKISPEAEKGFMQRLWNKFRKNPDSNETPKVEARKQSSTDIKTNNQQVKTETNKETKKKNRPQSIILSLLRKNSDIPVESPTETSIEGVKSRLQEQAGKTNPNKLKKLFSQLTNKEKQDIQTEEVIVQVDERLETASNSGKIKNIFHQLVKSANPQDIQKITAKLPQMNRGPIKEIWPKIQSLFQMVLDPKAAWTSKALAIGSLLYLISPFDAIPDIIPVAGLTDDAAVIVSVFSVLAFELSQYAKQSADKGVQVAEEIADIEVRKYNRIVRITLTGSILAAILAIAVKFILKNI